jgi:hypothetical protein
VGGDGMTNPLAMIGEWRPITNPRIVRLSCCGCGGGAINESNRLRREGWQETVGTPRRYRCGGCSGDR